MSLAEQAAERLSPLSPRHVQSTTKRALKGAQPLRDDIQVQVTELRNRKEEVAQVGGEVDSELQNVNEHREESYRCIIEEFEMQHKKIEEQLEARKNELLGFANAHYKLVEEAMQQKKADLQEETSRVDACVIEGEEALALDDAWFIQAYPDIQLKPGTSYTQATRKLLQSDSRFHVDFDQEHQGNAKINAVFMPQLSGHGQTRRIIAVDQY